MNLALCAAFILQGFTASSSLAAENATLATVLALNNFVIDGQESEMTVRFGVKTAETGRMEDLLKNGAPLSLKCSVFFYIEKSLRPDILIGEESYIAELGFDSLTEEFVLRLPRAEYPRQGKNLKNLLNESMNEIHIPIRLSEKLVRGTKYTVTLKIAVSRLDIPRWVKRTLFFLSWEPAEDTEYRLDFKY